MAASHDAMHTYTQTCQKCLCSYSCTLYTFVCVYTWNTYTHTHSGDAQDKKRKCCSIPWASCFDNDTAFIKIIRTVVPAAHDHVNIFLWAVRRRRPHDSRIRNVNFDKKLSPAGCCRCCVVAGSIKTRHQFICPELSLAHLIHLVAVRRGEQDWQTKQIKGRTGLGHFDLSSGAYERLVLIEGDTRNPLANGNGLQKLRCTNYF